MDSLPAYISLVFIATTIATISFLYYAVFAAEGKRSYVYSTVVLILVLLWMSLTGYLAHSGFLLDFESLPPRFVLIIMPPNLLIIALLMSRRTRIFLMRLPLTTLTYLHMIRVPVEIVLWWLALSGIVPLLLTFEGINYDILSGVTAPFVAIFLVGRKKNKIGAIIWNLAALLFLINIVSHAILSTPYPFQQYSLDQPMTAVFHLPFVWLPGVIVPIVLFAHLVSLMQLLTRSEIRS